MRTWRDQARDDARAIIQAALLAVNPQTVMRALRIHGGNLVLPGGEHVRLAGRKVRLGAVGKAAGGMAAHAQPWGPFEEAVIVAPQRVDVPGMEMLVSDHPTPTQRSVRAGERLLEMAEATAPDDLFVLLISGGASALAEAPAVPLEDLQRTNDLLLRSATPIQEINTVRKHLSRLKGGRLAQACRGEMLVLGISDVPQQDLSSLGSGPASPDPTTFRQARDVLRQRGLLEVVPGSVQKHLEAGAAGQVAETLKPGEDARVRSAVLADNETALMAAATTAARRGYLPRVLPEFLQGEAREVGHALGEMAREYGKQDEAPVAAILGGETVVRVLGGGLGGRNQETALAAVDSLGGEEAVLACFGTDGVDGPTDAAGAIVDGMTKARAQALGLDVQAHLAENDAYSFFHALQDLIKTGPTGTNVRDVAVLLVKRGGRDDA